MSKKKKIVSEATVLEKDDDSVVAQFKTDSEGNIVVGVELEEVVKKMNLDVILAQPIIEQYESMFASLILDTGTKDLWQRAFFDVYLYALALKAGNGEGDE